ncbi:synaptotagmin-like 4, variant 2 [Schistosoma haematobium]|uniref:Synaptotagmin-like 4, variant 2 n=1 Tax=Schistosoma haematobium TaxID=6185 RepID=A0A922LSL8_SCHHA|nr:synaptotagmin-like 4, variant 2 [Schistosoma haematobium]KAH9592375.1 synaptotagmin-like 4, variant 2 [Schistosoma haematobium]
MLIEETHPVKSKEKSRSKSPQTLKTQNSWEYLKSGSQSTMDKKLSGFLEQSTLSRSQSCDYLGKINDSSEDHEEFKKKSGRRRRLLRLKRLLKKSKSYKSNHYKAYNEMDELIHGEIDVSMEYNAQDQQLGVSLWAANNLAHEKYIIGLPHATISLLPDNVKYNLKVSGNNKWDGRDAVFDLSVCFTVHRCDLNKKIIVIKLWSRNGIKSQFTIGQTVIPIKECNLLFSPCRKCFQLISENNSIITNPNINTAYYGEIKLALRFAISDYQKKVLCVTDEAIDLIGVLNVWIKEGKNLHSQKAGTDINSYVTVELTDPDHKTECRSTDQILRSDQPVWNSLLQFSDKHLSELIESTMKIFIWNRSSSFSDPELLGIVQIANKESELMNTINDNNVNANVYQGSTITKSTSLWESVISKPGDWIEGLLNITAPNIK